MTLNRTIWIFLLCCAGMVSAQSPVFRFTRYTTENGLADNNTNPILQDSNGFIWAGSSNGLSRFDGSVFKSYMRLGKNGLTDLSVISLAEDNSGNIWISTGNGLNKFNPHTSNITHYYEGTGPGTIPYRWCNFLFNDKKGNLWLTSEKGIALYDPAADSFRNFPVSLYGVDSKANKFINRILEDRKGRLWLATSYGVKLFNRENKSVRSFHLPELDGQPRKENVILSIYEDHQGTIWAGSWGGGLLRLNDEKQEFEKAGIGNMAFESPAVSAITEIPGHEDEGLMVVINGALYKLRDRLHSYTVEKISLLALNPGTSEIKEPQFASLLWDQHGSCWLTGNSGLYQLEAADPSYVKVSVPAAGKEDHYIWHIIGDIGHPGKQFFLTTVTGWWKFDRTDLSVKRWPLPRQQEHLLRFINNWYPDSNGYWFTSVEGFGYYDLRNNRVTDLTNLVLANSGQASTGFITRDHYGRYWITMRRTGILIYDPVRKTASSLFADSAKPGTLYGQTIRDLHHGPDGNIYCTSENHLYRINPSDYSFSLYEAPPYEEKIDARKIAPSGILVTRNNHIFLISDLRIYEFVQNRLQTVFPAAGLSPFTLINMSEDALGNFWVNTSKGCFKVTNGFRSWINTSARAGWNTDPGAELNTGMPGEPLLSGDGYLFLIRDSLLRKNINPPTVLISRLRLGEKERFLVSLSKDTYRTNFKNAVEIELSAIDFQPDKENKIMYRMDGWDNAWNELNGGFIVRYEQLPPGSYTFRAKSLSPEGAESPVTEFTFSVIPPFYRTWWFLSLATLLVLISFIAFYRYRLRKAVEMEKLRTRIATDLHDDIGATLSSISMYSDAIKGQVRDVLPHLEPVLDRIGENSREMVTSMSDIVWAINPQNDEGEKLITRMQNHARDICSVKNILLQFESDEEVAALTLPLEYRKNIYLIFKEALNNALKYAQASAISLSLFRKNKDLVLTLTDDGIGFVPGSARMGNGMKNLKERAAEIGAAISIESAPGKGTSVVLTCPI